jgi:hypothetical protein
MTYAQFISIEYLYKWTIIPNNIDSEILTPYIRQASDTNIQSILGYALYMKLMNDLNTTGTWTGAYLDLMTNYVKPALAKWTLYHALPFIWSRITNQSVSKKQSDNSQPTSLEELKYLRDTIKTDAEYSLTRVRELIMNNQAAYPEFFQTSGPNRIKPRSNNYFSGIYIPRTANGWGPIDPNYGDTRCCDGI